MRELTFEEETAITLLETAVRLKPKATALKNGAEKLLSFLNSDRSERPKLTEKNIEELDTVLAKHGINLAVLLKTQPTTQAKQTPIVNPAMEAYKQAFGSNFLLINNNPEDTNQEFNIDLLKPYFQASTATGKPKTPEEQAKSNADKAQLNKDIESMVNQLPEFDSIETAKNKINEFVR